MGNITAIGNSSLLDPTWDTDCFNKFVDELAADITGSCMIPMNLPKTEVQNIVKIRNIICNHMRIFGIGSLD